MDLAHLEPWDAQSGCLNVIIETPKGSRNKFNYQPEEQLFQLDKVLPRGLMFPFDFGFIPSTLGDDGDSLDVLVLMEEPVPVGCKVPARLIGVIEAEQTDKTGTERNDRLIAVANCFRDQKGIHSIKDLSTNFLEEIEHFFASYNEMAGKKFRPLCRHGPHRAEKLVKLAGKRFRERTRDAEQANGSGRKAAKA